MEALMIVLIAETVKLVKALTKLVNLTIEELERDDLR